MPINLLSHDPCQRRAGPLKRKIGGEPETPRNLIINVWNCNRGLAKELRITAHSQGMNDQVAVRNRAGLLIMAALIHDGR